jgi:type II secretory pathway pseudopilin PulG
VTGAGGTRENGTTLIETMVSMLIFGIVMGVTTAVFITINYQTRDNLGRAESVQEARLGVMQIDRMVRSGNLFYDPIADGGDGMTLLVYTQANGNKHCVQWRVTSAGELQTRSWAPATETEEDATTWNTVARNLVNNTSGYSPVHAFELLPVGANGQKVLNVHLVVKDSRDSGVATNITEQISGRNTLYGYDLTVCGST